MYNVNYNQIRKTRVNKVYVYIKTNIKLEVLDQSEHVSNQFYCVRLKIIKTAKK